MGEEGKFFRLIFGRGGTPLAPNVILADLAGKSKVEICVFQGGREGKSPWPWGLPAILCWENFFAALEISPFAPGRPLIKVNNFAFLAEKSAQNGRKRRRWKTGAAWGGAGGLGTQHAIKGQGEQAEIEQGDREAPEGEGNVALGEMALGLEGEKEGEAEAQAAPKP